jgi:hypothetical protein
VLHYVAVAGQSLAADVLTGARLVRRLPALLRRPCTLDEAEVILARRLRERASDFLTLVQRAVYAQPGSPYQRLLAVAGCEYGDLAALVTRDGVEGALRTLFRAGVYLTVDEFKGRRPAVRGTVEIPVSPDLLRNPWSAFHVPARTGGSRGASVAVPLDLEFIRDRAVDNAVVLAARGGLGWRHALWGVPGGAATVRLLEFSAIGQRPVRWFSQVPPGAPGLHPRYRWSARAIRLTSLVAGRPLPAPEHVPIDAPDPILRWMTGSLRAGDAPHLHGFASSMVEVCRAAARRGLDLRGAHFTMASEPVTPARLAAVQATGAEARPCYAITDFGPVGYGCLAPVASDDVHLLRDLHGVIQAGPEGARAGLPPGALLLTSLRPTTPFVTINVSVGDQAVLTDRPCGCPLEALGWTAHLQDVRSFEKLTAGGMTFLSGDVVRVLEVALPARFGGGPTDYQLVEEEGSDTRARLLLLVHPRVGPLDAASVVDAFLAELGAGSDAERVMSLAWRAAGLVTLRREAARATEAGKVLHLHVARPAAPARRAGPTRAAVD